MTKFALEINLANAKLTVPFDSVDQLGERLKELDFKMLEQTLSLNLKTVLKSGSRSVKPTLQGICTFRPDGSLEFSKPAKSKLETIGLILYAYDPDPVDSQTIGNLAAEKNPAAYLGHKNYGKYFKKIGLGIYGLSHEGRLWVSSKIIPNLLKEQ